MKLEKSSEKALLSAALPVVSNPCLGSCGLACRGALCTGALANISS